MRIDGLTNYDYQDVQLISRVLNLYYVEEMTQAEVGRRLGLSTAKVNRLLKQAHQAGMIEINIHMPFQHLFDLEARLKAVFGITDVVVIPRVAKDPESFTYTLGRAAANYLLERLRDGDVVGIGGGTGVHSIVRALDPPRSYDVTIVPMIGAVQGQVTTDVNYLAAQMAERLGGQAYQLHAPAFAETKEQRDTLKRMGPIKDILDIARQANIAVLGIGTVDAEQSRFVEFTALSREDLQWVARSCGGVGEVLAYVYDHQGQPCAEEYSDRVVGLTLQELQRIPSIIGVAATASKAMPVYGALRGNHLHSLITDEAAAQGVLQILEGEFQDKSLEMVQDVCA